MDVAGFLRTLGLQQYEAAFRDNAIDAGLLPKLTAQDLKDLGIARVGHRRILLDAIAALREPVEVESATPFPPMRAEPATDAERRQVTVMFCDLVGSTALAAALDPEDLHALIGRYHACVAATVVGFNGFVAKYIGDGVLIYFGYPRAHEDDAEQAVRAGLALVEAVGALALTPTLSRFAGEGERQPPLPLAGEGWGEGSLQVRIGIATGVVVVGDLIGVGSAQEQAIVGETPNLAARLQALAEPNAIIIAESTRGQIGTLFEIRDLGPQSLKGFAAPQLVWRVLSENRALGRFEALRSGATALVGRGEELDLLLRRWVQAAAGGGRVVLISAEPGVGKSRLGEVLAERLAGAPHIRLRYFCSPHYQDSALYPVIAQAERAAEFLRDDAPGEKLAKLRAALAPAELAVEDLALLADMHSLPAADLLPPLELTPERKKEKTFAALLRQIENLSQQQPVLMLFEDLHWTDPSTRELLDRLVERIANWPVLLVATFRAEFTPQWAGAPHVTVLNLARLDRRDTMAMIEQVAGKDTLPADVVQEIGRRTDGVPLFIEELTKAVLESAAPGALLSAAPSVPATLHASLAARLDRLGAAAKDVAQKGAVIGREFGYDVLAAIADLPEPQLADSLDRLTKSGLLFVHGTAPESSYIFKHALVQDVAYGTLLRSRRQHLHGRIAVVLEDGFPEIVQAQPALLARHCAEGGLPQKAVVHWLRAGRQAIARSAMTEAVGALCKGLEVLDRLPDDLWRRQQELDLHIALRPALAATKGFSAAEVGETIARTRVLAEQVDRPEYLVPLSFGQWGFHSIRSEHRLALSIAEQIEQFGSVRNDFTTQLLARRALGITRCQLGELVAARDLLEQCDGLSDPAHRAIGAGLSYDPYAAMLAHLTVTLANLGYLDQARSRLNEAFSEAERLQHAHTLAVVLAHANLLEAMTGASELQGHAEQLLTLSAEQGFPLYLGWATAFRGKWLVARGQAPEGHALLAQGLAAIRATGAVLNTPWLLVWLAEAAAMLGQAAEGLNWLADAARVIETTDERFAEAELHRVRGELLNAAGDRAAAERAYHNALGVTERQSARLLQLRASTGLARLWRDRGSKADARALLAPIYAWFTEGFDTRDLIEARRLLNDLESA